MKISTRGRYGVRLLIDLAEHPDEDRLALATIADRQRISVRYLEQVAVILRRAGFIRSVKGASGGFSLALPPTEIIIGDVLRALEGDLLTADPVQPGVSESAYRQCVRSMVYDRLDERIAAVVDRLTLASLLASEVSGSASSPGKTECADESYMYFL